MLGLNIAKMHLFLSSHLQTRNTCTDPDIFARVVQQYKTRSRPISIRHLMVFCWRDGDGRTFNAGLVAL